MAMKILLLGDASNYHNALSIGLTRLGHDVTVASAGSMWMDTARNIDLRRSKNKMGGAWLWVKLNTILAGRLKGYDVVQLVNPIFVDLRPHRVASLFKKLKRDNGAVYLTALGTDTSYVMMGLSSDSPLRYTEWSVEGKPTPFSLSALGAHHRLWLEEPLLSHARMIYDNVDGVVSALYEYHKAMEAFVEPSRLAYGGLPVDVNAIPFCPPSTGSTAIRVLAPYHAGREQEKGTDIMRELAQSVKGLDLQPVTGLRFQDFQRRLESCDVVLDQYYSYTPATTALMAMAMGKTVVTGAEADYERFIGEKVPAFNIDPTNHDGFIAFLEGLSCGEGLLDGKKVREFVERHHDAQVVASRFVDFWTR